MQTMAKETKWARGGDDELQPQFIGVNWCGRDIEGNNIESRNAEEYHRHSADSTKQARGPLTNFQKAMKAFSSGRAPLVWSSCSSLEKMKEASEHPRLSAAILYIQLGSVGCRCDWLLGNVTLHLGLFRAGSIS